MDSITIGDTCRFAFIIHPLSVRDIHLHPRFGWTRLLPDQVLERIAAMVPPFYLGKFRGMGSGATRQKVEGFLYTLGATPGQLKRWNEEFTYKRLVLATRLAERRGASLMGLGAFTSVVGDAGLTVASRSNIGITNGNSLTVAITLETAAQALRCMGKSNPEKLIVMVVGAGGSVGSLCARLLAKKYREIILVSREPNKIEDVKDRIGAETPGVKVSLSGNPDEHLPNCDLIITATSAVRQRVLDITYCKPGTVICDVGRPQNVSKEEADLRPDVLVVESGVLTFPGDLKLGYDMQLPPGTVYACLAETATLAMEKRYEDFSIGRDIPLEMVEEIHQLSRRHNFQLAGLRSFDQSVHKDELTRKRELARQLACNPVFSETKHFRVRKSEVVAGQ